ncbi:hypothetical protein BWI96_05980 [Siphonobacter sp. SORGH_AS_0500]|uniref:YEATS-associated helix-containing protein n=1 Tax=Siphonobacter sp. SORGH_AS_0500 TaxID=1864824 RepID=UPI000CA7256E|nr:YEATS-associated helix-containing protein [Siphonobacter sp. SORGH_AS_0500]PKK37416.1 hypothetical protein BWI96_05980 [Siphonobacter sp. SORGH_AS_0500]
MNKLKLFLFLVLMLGIKNPIFSQSTDTSSAQHPNKHTSEQRGVTSDKEKKYPFDLASMLIIISLSGLIGGYANYRRTVNQLSEKTSEKEQTGNSIVIDRNEQNKYLQTCLILGIVAASLVPLFLNSVSSALLDDKNDITILIFVGFCLLAAISSSSFIDALSQRILNQVKNLRNETAKQVRESADLLRSAKEIITPNATTYSTIESSEINSIMLASQPATHANFKFEIKLSPKTKLVRIDIDGSVVEGNELLTLASTAENDIIKGEKFVPLVDDTIYLIIDAVGEPNHQITLTSFKFQDQDLLNTPQNFTIGDNRRGQLDIESIKLA